MPRHVHDQLSVSDSFELLDADLEPDDDEFDDPDDEDEDTGEDSPAGGDGDVDDFEDEGERVPSARGAPSITEPDCRLTATAPIA